MKQRSDEWFKARAGRITASRFIEVLDRRRWLDVYRDIKAAPASTPSGGMVNQHTAWGIGFEAEALDVYSQQRKVVVQETGLHLLSDTPSSVANLIGASPDGLIAGSGLVEVKCPSNPDIHTTTRLRQRIPAEYMPQVLGAIWVTGRAYCDFVSYDPREDESRRLVVIRQRAPKLHDASYVQFRRTIYAFAEHLKDAVPPEPESTLLTNTFHTICKTGGTHNE